MGFGLIIILNKYYLLIISFKIIFVYLKVNFFDEYFQKQIAKSQPIEANHLDSP